MAAAVDTRRSPRENGFSENDFAVLVRQYITKVQEHREVERRLESRRRLFRFIEKPYVFFLSVRDKLKNLNKLYDKSEDDLRALHSVGQIVGEVLKPLDDGDKCKGSVQCVFCLVLRLNGKKRRIKKRCAYVWYPC